MPSNGRSVSRMAALFWVYFCWVVLLCFHFIFCCCFAWPRTMCCYEIMNRWLSIMGSGVVFWISVMAASLFLVFWQKHVAVLLLKQLQ
ncbi:hypothetical protein MtrunA17_Chr4g0019201 [Medicago truncatula]|uniref:Transmembrane protein n=1 Tax=Medicago truncatula TaxID=3880 RepID=A0A396I559_MEDTR|nr:hypothetical protein MtrunA17_Chr4g0019201 [Medicago truncatula]